MAKRKSVSIDEQVLGQEPQWGDQATLSDMEFKVKYGNALNWYNYFFDKGKAKAVVTKYLKEYQPDDLAIIDAVRKVPDWAIGSTLTAICKMKMNGLTRNTDSTTAFMERRFTEIVEQASKIVEEKDQEEKPQKRVVSLQERVTDAAREQSNGIEDAIEECANNGYKSDFDCYKYLKGQQVKGMIAKRMIDFYAGEANELEEALEGKCEQLVEGYSHFSKADLKRFAKFMRMIVDDLTRWSDNQKQNRKPRKVKPKPISKQVEKVKYLKAFDELKLVSIAPENVVGAMVVWVYNTKYRKLGKYVASTREGFAFKGTTLQKFDETQSVQKKLRKPEEVVGRCLTGGKIVLRKLLDEIKTNEQPMTGRFNEDTIILRTADL